MIKTGDRLVDVIFSALGQQKIRSDERAEAILRASFIAQAYVNAPSEIRDAVFGSCFKDMLENDEHYDAALIVNDGVH